MSCCPWGGKGRVPFAPLTGNMLPPLMLHHIATAKEAEDESECDLDVTLSSTRVKGKRKGASLPPLCLNLRLSRLGLTLMPLCPLQR